MVMIENKVYRLGQTGNSFSQSARENRNRNKDPDAMHAFWQPKLRNTALYCPHVAQSA